MICPRITRTDASYPARSAASQLPELRVVVLRDHRPMPLGDRVDLRHHRLPVVVEDRVAVVVEDGFLDQFDAGGPTPRPCQRIRR